MRKMLYTFACLTLTAALFVLTGCGGDASGGGSKKAVDSSDSTSSMSAVDAIKKRGVLTLATGTYVPFEFRDEKTNEIIGFDVDFAQLIADKLEVDLKVTDMDFKSIVPSVQKGDYDIAIAAMYDTPERREQVLMSDSYMSTGMVLVAPKGNPKKITSLADCDSLVVGYKVGGTSEKVALEAMEEHEITFVQKGYDETVGHAMDLEAGRVDVVVNDLLNQMELNKTFLEQEIITEPFTEADLSIAVKKGNEDLLKLINDLIKEYKEDGTYEELYKKWIE
ncbi:ABC transporter substrate-binding protein [Vagococcus elongatus]|uniref:Solute-binding protein family 3/N-terminal domain-containing protein n=1 Tax=Vagococcus elongatus TaxID=180344 RepID=A0A430ARR4_9ENTE|nr:ABC transporter substrate-binding protein [Vagococcus elongatus]RSU10744.1 hypothetical protein CBF29_09175 [Vagococcus elongatus]